MLQYPRNPYLSAAVVVLLLAGCKSSSPAAAAADSGVAAAPAPSKAPPAPAPLVGPALSYAEPVSPQRCEWGRQPLPSGQPTRLALDAPCNELFLSISPDGREGLAFSVIGARAWRLDFAARSVQPLELSGVPGGKGGKGPDMPYLSRVAFDTEGRPTALVGDVYVDRPVERGPGGERSITFEGQRYTVKEKEGLPGLALAYRLEGTAWKRVETKAAAFDPEDAPDVSFLDTAKTLRTHMLSVDNLPGQETPEATAFKLTSALLGTNAPGKWMTLSTPGGPVHYLAAESPAGEVPFYASTPVTWGDGLVALEGVSQEMGDSIMLQLQGDLLLVVASDGGTLAAHVYDTRTKEQLALVKNVQSAILWPEPVKR